MLAAAGSIAFSGKAIIVKLAYRHGVDAVTLIFVSRMQQSLSRETAGSEVHHIEKARRGAVIDLQTLEVEQVAVSQLRRHHVLQGAEHDFSAPRRLAFPVLQHLLDHLTLQVFLGATEVARNDREFLEHAVGLDVALAAIGQRANHHVAPVVGTQLGRHGLEGAAVEHIEAKGFQDIVAVMPQGHLGRADLVGEPKAARPEVQYS